MPRFSTSLTRSFRAAWRGILTAFRTERTFRVMLAAAFLIVAVIATLPLQDWERVLLLVLTGGVLVLELLNSLVERVADLLKPRLSSYVGEVKDLMAAAVLTAAVFSALAGLLVVGPHLVTLFRQF
jgi:undecaprenol kinase